tara:strand:- start:57 stop:671 length:615 start_codon:yes stop_codon:yes gene_type:complete
MKDYSKETGRGLLVLAEYFKKSGFEKAYRDINRIIVLSSIPGVDLPADETELDGPDELLKFLSENPGELMYFDIPIGDKKKFGDKKIELPFHYGEFPSLINPSDNMGWDIIVVPSSSNVGDKYIDYGHNLVPVGIVPVNPSEDDWRSNTSSEDNPFGKPPPIGNDKVIMAPKDWSNNEELKRTDTSIINNFFRSLWQFSEVVWY